MHNARIALLAYMFVVSAACAPLYPEDIRGDASAADVAADATPAPDAQTAPDVQQMPPVEMPPGTDPLACRVNGQVETCAQVNGCSHVRVCTDRRWGSCLPAGQCGATDAGTVDPEVCAQNGALVMCTLSSGMPGYRMCSNLRWSACTGFGTPDAGTPPADSAVVTDATPVVDVATDTGPVDAGTPDTGSAPADSGVVDAGPADTGPVDSGPAIVGNGDRGNVTLVTAGLRGNVEIREINPLPVTHCGYVGTGSSINRCTLSPRFVENVGRFEFGVFVNGVSVAGISDETCRVSIQYWQLGVFDAAGQEVALDIRSTGTTCVIYLERFYSVLRYSTLMAFEDHARWYLNRDAGVPDAGVVDSGTPDTGVVVDSGTVVDAGPCASDPSRGLIGTVCNNSRSGACLRTGALVCNSSTGRVECNAPVITGVAETCNGIDDDCDGSVDEGLGTVSCGTGSCLRTVNRCVGGVVQVCTPPVEICSNGVDDDCDGMIDEGCVTTDAGVPTGRIVYEVQTTNTVYSGLVPMLVNQYWAPQTCLNTGSINMEAVTGGGFRCIVAARLEVFNYSYEHPSFGTIGVVQPNSSLPRTCTMMPGVAVRVYAEGTGVSQLPAGGPRTAVVGDQCRVSL